LAVCAGALGKLGSMPALSEDRFLTNIKRLQRFGTQFAWAGERTILDPVDTRRPTAVTDDLRLSFLVPPLAISRKHGSQANQVAQKQVFAHIEERRDPNHRPVGNAAVSAELRSLKAGDFATKRVLFLYDRNGLVTDEDFVNVSRILMSSKDSSELILAHELAMLALVEGDHSAGPLFESTWDAFVQSISREPRYSKQAEPMSVRRVLEGAARS
jgi:hypothetical protein